MENYFTSEGIVCRREELQNEKEVCLLVLPVNAENGSKTIGDFIQGAEGSIIVDIDLDFFSTKNPFLDLYPEANLYSKLMKLYAFEESPSGLPDEAKINFALESCQRRAQLLDELEHIFAYLNDHDTLEGYHGLGEKHIKQVSDIKDAIEAHCEGDIDWMIIHNAGCTCDDTELPNHVSDEAEIDQLVESTRRLLGSLSSQAPGLLTMSRSSLDEFCPPNQVDMIQDKAVNLLTTLYSDVHICHDYRTNEI